MSIVFTGRAVTNQTTYTLTFQDDGDDDLLTLGTATNRHGLLTGDLERIVDEPLISGEHRRIWLSMPDMAFQQWLVNGQVPNGHRAVVFNQGPDLLMKFYPIAIGAAAAAPVAFCVFKKVWTDMDRAMTIADERDKREAVGLPSNIKSAHQIK